MKGRSGLRVETGSESERSLQLALKWWVDEKDLADDLYATLDRLIPDDGVLGPSVAAVKARYRKARGR